MPKTTKEKSPQRLASQALTLAARAGDLAAAMERDGMPAELVGPQQQIAAALTALAKQAFGS